MGEFYHINYAYKFYNDYIHYFGEAVDYIIDNFELGNESAGDIVRDLVENDHISDLLSEEELSAFLLGRWNVKRKNKK
jgi:hypothetical protein